MTNKMKGSDRIKSLFSDLYVSKLIPNCSKATKDRIIIIAAHPWEKRYLCAAAGFAALLPVEDSGTKNRQPSPELGSFEKFPAVNELNA